MAARKKTTRRPAARRAGRPLGRLARLERDLPPSLRDFSRRVRRGLAQLERQIGSAQTRTRRQATRLLREASQQLGRFEAEGERRWKRLTGQARKRALDVLRRLEKALRGARARPSPARKTAPRGRAAAAS